MTAIAHHPQRVSSAIADARNSLAGVADVPVWSMGAAETTASLAQLQGLKAQVAELEARVLSHADRTEVGSETGTSKTANWHAHQTRTTRRAANRSMKLAHGRDHCERTRAALAEGHLHDEQALVIVQALAELPDDLDQAVVERAEEHLIAEAARYDAKTLKILGRRIFEVIDPDAADAHEAKLLEREELDALASTRIHLWEDSRGRLQGRFTLPPLEGAMFKKALLGLAAPRHRASKGPLGERRPGPERLGQAFCEYIARYPDTLLPKTGGVNATVVVTMNLDTLMGGLKGAQLDTGDRISASLARKLACEAGIIPAVLGGSSELLDLGRRKRFATRPQRIAKTVQTGGRCEVDGCDQPGAHVHHKTRWADGGKTDLDNLIGLCAGHHTRAHDPTFTMTRLPTGKYTFYRRT